MRCYNKYMENTSKNFVLQLGALVSLYVSLSALVAIMFGVINITFPDAAENYWAYESAQGSVRFGIATLIVAFPVYLFLTRRVNQIRRNETGVYLTLTRWLIYLSLFLGGVILLGDLIAVIWWFLNGEITVRFILKALALFAVIGSAFGYYLMDARNYWNSHESRSKTFGLAAAVFVVVVLAFGFLSIDTPQEVREYRLDEEQVSDLMDMQFRIEEHYRMEGDLPDRIDDLYVTSALPKPPPGRAPYRYQVQSDREYVLCATFARSSVRGENRFVRTQYEPSYAPLNYNWEHEAGEVCFERMVEPLDGEREA